jgi:DNA-binding NarL/FixJ family response regulator
MLSLTELTPRERHILERIAGGATNRGIAAELWLSKRTVESHVASIFRKLDLPDACERRVVAALAFVTATMPSGELLVLDR